MGRGRWSRCPLSRLVALLLQKLLQRHLPILHEAIPKTRKDIIHRFCDRPGIQIQHLIVRAIRILQRCNLGLNFGISRPLQIGQMLSSVRIKMTVRHGDHPKMQSSRVLSKTQPLTNKLGLLYQALLSSGAIASNFVSISSN